MMGLDISKSIRRDLGRKRSKASLACGGDEEGAEDGRFLD
jgi:hypothetical protein